MKKIIIQLLFLFLLNNISFGYINIFPTTFDKSISDNGGYQEFSLYNNTTMSIRYTIEPKPMENKQMIADMSKYTEVYPKVVTIKPGASEMFKVYVKAPKNMKDGDYGTYLNIKQINAPQIKNSNEENTALVGVAVRTNLNMGIYGYIGDRNPKLDLENIKIKQKNEKLYLEGELKNLTNRMVKLGIEAKGSKRNNFSIGEFRVFKNQKINFDNLIKDASKDEKIKSIIIKDKETDKLLIEINIKR
ncbi:MAG: hypothetical protein ACRDCE_10570 [Cetobacterium sp.]|uniref:COG1470 family protein n=1 Tax=Cetobacterium sp. TaxID=2071632 RepID=UPI003EE5698B